MGLVHYVHGRRVLEDHLDVGTPLIRWRIMTRNDTLIDHDHDPQRQTVDQISVGELST